MLDLGKSLPPETPTLEELPTFPKPELEHNLDLNSPNTDRKPSPKVEALLLDPSELTLKDSSKEPTHNNPKDLPSTPLGDELKDKSLVIQPLGVENPSPNDQLEFELEVLNLFRKTLESTHPSLDPKSPPLEINLPEHPILGTQDIEDTPIQPDPNPFMTNLEPTVDPKLGYEPPSSPLPKLIEDDPLVQPKLELSPPRKNLEFHALGVDIGTLSPKPLDFNSCLLDTTPVAQGIIKIEQILPPFLEVEPIEFIIPDSPLGNNISKHSVLALDAHSSLGTQNLEITLVQPKLGVDPNSSIFPQVGPNLDPKPSDHPIEPLVPHPLNYKSCLLGSTPQTSKLTNINLDLFPLHKIEHIDFVIPEHFGNSNVLYPISTNKVSRERILFVGDPKQLGQLKDRKDQNAKNNCCGPLSYFWTPITIDVEGPRLHRFTSHMHLIKDILEDKISFTYNEVGLLYLVRYTHSEEGWIVEVRLVLPIPDLLTHCKDNSPEENFFHPGRADVGRRHNPKKYKWSFRSP